MHVAGPSLADAWLGAGGDEAEGCALSASGHRNAPCQNALFTTPPSTRSAAPVVAEASGLAT